MSVLDWLFVSLLSGAILFGFLGLLFLVLGFKQRQKQRALQSKRPKPKKKRKRWQRQCRQLKKQASQHFRRGLILLVLTILSVGGGVYARYYQQTNLNTTDGEIIVQSYFLVDELDKELKKIDEGADAGKAQEKLREVTGMLVSYTSQTPSNGLTKEGQQLLRRYYTKVKEFGLNIDGQSVEQLNQVEIRLTFQEDIARIRKDQQKVFKTFGINESALKQKK